MDQPFSSRRTAARVLWLALASSLSGCDEGSPPALDPVDIQAPARCPSGHTLDVDGGCLAVGIQGCAEVFLGEDRLCHPTMAACPPGTIPSFAEGCVGVGIPACAPAFVEADGVCHPGMAKCPAGTFAVPRLGCVPFDGPEGCGTGTWGNIADEPGTVYVDPSYTGQAGVGSRARPVKTIAEAIALVPADGRIALAAATYEEPVTLAKAVELVGRCPSMVRLVGASAWLDPPRTIQVDARDVAIRSVQIGGGRGIGILAEEGADVRVEQVRIEGAAFSGVAAVGPGTRVSLRRSVVRGTRPFDGGSSSGVFAMEGGELSISESAVVENAIFAVAATGPGTAVTLNDSLIEGTLPDASGELGHGIALSAGAHVEVNDSAIARSVSVGIQAEGQGTSLVTSGSLIEQTLPCRVEPQLGYGLQASGGATMTLRSCVVLNNATVGVSATGAGSSVSMTGNLVQGTWQSSEVDARAVGVQQGASMTMDSNAIVLNHNMGIAASESLLVATGNLIEGTMAGPQTRDEGTAVDIRRSSQGTLTANAIVKNTVLGVQVASDGTRAVIAENLVEGTRPRPNSEDYGAGVQVRDGASLELTSSVVMNNHNFGVGAYGVESVPRLTVAGSLVAATATQASDGEMGVGIAAVMAELGVTSSVLRDNQVGGIVVNSADLASAHVESTLIDGVLGGKFTSSDGALHDGIGDGILAVQTALVTLRGVVVRRCVRAGILYFDASGAIDETRSADNGFGLVVEGSTSPKLGERNSFTDNRERDQVVGGDFAVPSAPPPLP